MNDWQNEIKHECIVLSWNKLQQHSHLGQVKYTVKMQHLIN